MPGAARALTEANGLAGFRSGRDDLRGAGRVRTRLAGLIQLQREPAQHGTGDRFDNGRGSGHGGKLRRGGAAKGRGKGVSEELGATGLGKSAKLAGGLRGRRKPGHAALLPELRKPCVGADASVEHGKREQARGEGCFKPGKGAVGAGDEDIAGAQVSQAHIGNFGVEGVPVCPASRTRGMLHDKIGLVLAEYGVVPGSLLKKPAQVKVMGFQPVRVHDQNPGLPGFGKQPAKLRSQRPAPDDREPEIRRQQGD